MYSRLENLYCGSRNVVSVIVSVEYAFARNSVLCVVVVSCCIVVISVVVILISVVVCCLISASREVIIKDELQERAKYTSLWDSYVPCGLWITQSRLHEYILYSIM